jgi:hypothetical protein
MRDPTEQRVFEYLSAKLDSGLSPAARRQLAEEGTAWKEETAAKAAATLLASGEGPSEIQNFA